MGLLRIIRDRPNIVPGDLSAGAPVSGDTILRAILLDCGFQDSDHTQLRYIARLQPSAEGTESGDAVVLAPLEVAIEEERNHHDVIADDVLAYYPPHYHIECDVNGNLEARYLQQAGAADYTLAATTQVERIESSDDIRTEVVHRGLRRTNTNIAAASQGGAVFECDISDLTEPIPNDINTLIDEKLGTGTAGSWTRPRPFYPRVYVPGVNLMWGVYLDDWRDCDQNAARFTPWLLSYHDLFVLKLPNNTRTSPFDHADEDLTDTRQPIGRVQVVGGAGWRDWLEWRNIDFEVQILYYDEVYSGGLDHPLTSSAHWQPLCEGGEAERLGVRTSEWAEVDENAIGHRFAKYLLFRLVNAYQPINISYQNYRYMATFQEVRVWLPETVYGYARLGTTSPFNTAGDQSLYNQLRRRTYVSPLDYYQDTQASADARAVTELGELYRHYSKLRVTGIRPDAQVGQTVRVTSEALGIDADYMIETVNIQHDLTTECELVAYRV